LYGFVIFLLLMLVHFTLMPMFRFIPGGKGIIPIATSSDYTLYWAKGVQPITPAPDRTVVSDTLRTYRFVKSYTVSADICLTSLAGHSGLDRLIFFCSNEGAALPSPLTPNLSLSENFATRVNGASMICYVADNTNDLIVTYFMKSARDGSIVQRSSFPIQNIPLYTPFRITIVYDMNLFTVYFNGVQVSQTTLTQTNPRNDATNHAFYANTLSSKCGYVQTLLLWNRPLAYSEITGNTVALTPMAKFAMPPKTASVPGGSCSS
jgi:hypothetical protein